MPGNFPKWCEGCGNQTLVCTCLKQPDRELIKLSGVLDARINTKREIELYLAGDLELSLSRTEQVNLLKLLESALENSN